MITRRNKRNLCSLIITQPQIFPENFAKLKRNPPAHTYTEIQHFLSAEINSTRSSSSGALPQKQSRPPRKGLQKIVSSVSRASQTPISIYPYGGDPGGTGIRQVLLLRSPVKGCLLAPFKACKIDSGIAFPLRSFFWSSPRLLLFK